MCFYRKKTNYFKCRLYLVAQTLPVLVKQL
jgi:hypothetical protein